MEIYLIISYLLNKNNEVFDSFIEDLEHTRKVLFPFRNRHFTTSVKVEQYPQNIQNIKKAPILVFNGSSDNVSFDSQSNLVSTVWTVVNFDGGHMQGAGILGDTYWSAITKYLGR